mmetsp:Transcript_1403/g.2758  ORF Transcript_1403/g.2758 Transcript_1403/m.2758 type:complete len:216 (+) Transcript_1403:1703-2350(+)
MAKLKAKLLPKRPPCQNRRKKTRHHTFARKGGGVPWTWRMSARKKKMNYPTRQTLRSRARTIMLWKYKRCNTRAWTAICVVKLLMVRKRRTRVRSATMIFVQNACTRHALKNHATREAHVLYGNNSLAPFKRDEKGFSGLNYQNNTFGHFCWLHEFRLMLAAEASAIYPAIYSIMQLALPGHGSGNNNLGFHDTKKKKLHTLSLLLFPAGSSNEY